MLICHYINFFFWTHYKNYNKEGLINSITNCPILITLINKKAMQHGAWKVEYVFPPSRSKFCLCCPWPNLLSSPVTTWPWNYNHKILVYIPLKLVMGLDTYTWKLEMGQATLIDPITNKTTGLTSKLVIFVQNLNP